MEEKINVVELENKKPEKNNSKVLAIIGSVFLVISLILFGFFLAYTLPLFMGTEDFGSAIGAVLGLVFFLIPGVIISIISSVVNGISWHNANKGKTKVYSLVTFIISLVILVMFIGLFIYLRFR